MKVAVLMAVYNGEKYLSDQIESIIRQSYTEWHLYVRDDGSTDKSLEIVKQYVEKYSDRITLLHYKTPDHGCKHNFIELCKDAVKRNFEYFMFCDQDDVWNGDKIKKSLYALKRVEKSLKTNEPILVHTDLEVVNENLKCIGTSFVKYRALNPDVCAIEKLLVQNNVTGCTMFFNRALMEKALECKDVSKIALHDWWFTVVAALFGKIVYVNEPTIKYRQHGGNEVGATKVNTIGFIMKRLMGYNHIKETINMSARQAEELMETYGLQISNIQRDLLSKYVNIKSHNKIVRAWIVIKNGFLKQGLVQIIGELMFI